GIGPDTVVWTDTASGRRRRSTAHRIITVESAGATEAAGAGGRHPAPRRPRADAADLPAPGPGADEPGLRAALDGRWRVTTLGVGWLARSATGSVRKTISVKDRGPCGCPACRRAVVPGVEGCRRSPSRRRTGGPRSRPDGVGGGGQRLPSRSR